MTGKHCEKGYRQPHTDAVDAIDCFRENSFHWNYASMPKASKFQPNVMPRKYKQLSVEQSTWSGDANSILIGGLLLSVIPRRTTWFRLEISSSFDGSPGFTVTFDALGHARARCEGKQLSETPFCVRGIRALSRLRSRYREPRQMHARLHMHESRCWNSEEKERRGSRV